MRKKNRVVIVSVASVAVAGLLVGGFAKYANASTKVNAFAVQAGSMSNITELNGRVASARDMAYFGVADVKVKEVKVKIGDRVKKGDVLVTFDNDDIERAIAMIAYEEEIEAGNYKNSVETSNRYQALYNEAEINLGVLNQQIKDTEEAIAAKQKEITDRQSALSYEGAKIQAAIVDKSGDPTSDEYKNEVKTSGYNAYYQQFDGDLVRLQQELQALNVQLADFKEYKAEMVSQKAASNAGRMTSGMKSQMDASMARSEADREERLARLNEAKNGIVAEFDGVVTGLNVQAGSSVAYGMQIAKVESTDDIIVRCDVNKYDIMSIEPGQSATVSILGKDYNATVTRIDGATSDSLGGTTVGVGVEMEVENPDDGIILGMEVKPAVSTASLTDVISIPREAVIEDEDETYVFVEKDKKASKVNVVTGVKNDEYVEITSGLSEGDTVVWNENDELKNGEDVRISQ